ncbi:UDP-N-acetylmuramoyl-tripeptide--D-alanyl-D-alanine ligase [uncultured Jatrophihabitans sp.]|uniref:UDP-N-acetylmuramoyl-tripeptide--D-alanyl-D- alanine ligase n=1 Tax=uncultured Jatrophihabitans sp. TaxID=1610747 RepID=UPI0035CA16E6
MIALTLGEVAGIVGGRLVGADPATPVIGSVEFDSRQITPGGLFLALPGEHVDGHDFVDAVAAAGAAASLVTRPVDGPVIEVADGFAALAALAAAVVRRLPDALVIGVTGSSGKTSTKDVLAQLLARLGPTVAPPGSFNNELGHPYTVLRADPSTRFLVLETSARGIGHIRYLAEIAPPRIGVVLNVGSAHLGEFGSRQAIAQAKGELVEALPPGGLAVLNADDPLVLAMRTRTQARVLTVGRSEQADLRAENVELDALGRASFDLVSGADRRRVALRLVGEHHVGNVLAAAAVALECGMAFAELVAELGEVTPASRWRMEVTERRDDVLVINDAYNANPESVRAALQTLAAVGSHRAGRTFAVLGEMAELGDDGPAQHQAVGRLAARLHVAHVIAVGEVARPIQQGAALESSAPDESRWVPDVDAAIALLRSELRAADVVLVKASRAARLERVAEAITDGAATDDGGEAG